MEPKRYFWLKLQHDFFASKRIKKLRTMAGGDTFVIIYLKMQLLSIKTNGVLTFTGLDKDFASELAIDLDESAENVAITLAYLKATGLIETSDDVNFLLPYARENTGAETAAAGRMREMRARRNLPEIEAERNNVRTMCELRNGEIESEKEIDTPPIVPPTGGNNNNNNNSFSFAHEDERDCGGRIENRDAAFADLMTVANYLKNECAVDLPYNPYDEAEKFIAWNNLHGTDPKNWKKAARLWAARLHDRPMPDIDSF